MKEQVLIVEDDNDINQLLADVLTRAGYAVTQAYSGTEAKLLFGAGEFSLLLLDLMLPGLTGEELLPIIRQQSNLPVIVLSAKESQQDKIAALRMGADDYITKPFYPDELLARVEANLRRMHSVSPAAVAQPLLIYKDVELDAQARTVQVAGAEVSLTAREFDILALLMGNPQKVFTKSNLYRSVWNDEFMGDDNTVNVHISNLRSKLGKGEYIQTVWGIGFKMREE